MGPIFPIVTLGFALFLSAIPLPMGHQHWMPAWLSLVAFWLVLHQPRYMTVLIAWVVGLVFDPNSRCTFVIQCLWFGGGGLPSGLIPTAPSSSSHRATIEWPVVPLCLWRSR